MMIGLVSTSAAVFFAYFIDPSRSFGVPAAMVLAATFFMAPLDTAADALAVDVVWGVAVGLQWTTYVTLSMGVTDTRIAGSMFAILQTMSNIGIGAGEGACHCPLRRSRILGGVPDARPRQCCVDPVGDLGHPPLPPRMAASRGRCDHRNGVMFEPISLLQDLIRIDTTNPPGNEAAAVERIHEPLGAAGIDCVVLARDPARPNLIARIPGRKAAPPLLMQGHVDIVPTGGQIWQRDPFGGEIIDGYLWGRGALDMKGAVVMMTHAMVQVAEPRVDAKRRSDPGRARR
jgi:hypothetical protein